ncbi:c-type cytochrome [Mucilaginibacter sp. RS28]|uniref:Photosynthetic reaction center cytochrome c subunit n=1 Tax=Mucilaginibacter straminoryzae TaxID=2932774 RepID=A0A9X1X2G2_9SPHI|nr:c-type cytochrome [Mucilaginibacter straminoryzae]MCJ8209919.1 c-type cytochrome [Mucilaginibacter straminoryzae]
MNKKLLATLSLSSVVVFTAFTAMQPGRPEPKITNLKVLPKNLTFRQVDHIMDEWSHALGVRCNFCHSPNPETKKMDWASDAKPEKHAAREMFKMMNSINKKYFKAEKDSLGVMMTTGVNCYSCHRGNPHPEVVSAPVPPRNGGPQAAPPAGATPAGTPPATPPPGNGR